MECKEGKKLSKGKCIKRSETGMKVSSAVGGNQIKGLILIALAFIVLKVLMPVQKACPWYNLFCHVGNVGTVAISPIYVISAAVLVVVGVLYLIDINLKSIITMFV